MEKSRFFRKFCAISALAVSAFMSLPQVVFAKGAVVGYVWGDNPVSNE